MTTKVNSVYESILSSIDTPSLVPVGPITVSTEPIDNEVEVIDDEISETEIAQKIIAKAKKLRKKIGDESYHYIRAIIDLAEKLLDMHPDIQIGEIEQVEESVEPDNLIPQISHVYDVLRKSSSTNAVEISKIYERLDGVPLEDFKTALKNIVNNNPENMYLEPHAGNDAPTPEEAKFFFDGRKFDRLAKF
jgi:hypothetical protein